MITKNAISEFFNWDRNLCQKHLVHYLAKLPVSPNQVTFATLVIGLLGIWVLYSGESIYEQVFGALLFAFARFGDWLDGALARLTDRVTRLGGIFDYAVGFTLLFLLLFVSAVKFGGEMAIWVICIGFILTTVPRVLMYLIQQRFSGQTQKLQFLEITKERMGFLGPVIADEVGMLPYYTFPLFALLGWPLEWCLISLVGALFYTVYFCIPVYFFRK